VFVRGREPMARRPIVAVFRRQGCQLCEARTHCLVHQTGLVGARSRYVVTPEGSSHQEPRCVCLAGDLYLPAE